MAEAMDTTPSEIEKLRAELAAEKDQRRAAEARTEYYTTQQRNVIDGMRPEITKFISELSESFPDYAAEMAPMQPWVEQCHKGVEPHNELPVVRTLQCASIVRKRDRDILAEMQTKVENYNDSMKQLEEERTKSAKLQDQNKRFESEVADLKKHLMDANNMISRAQGFSAVENRYRNSTTTCCCDIGGKHQCRSK